MKKAIRRSSSDNNNMETKTMKKAIRRSSSDNNNMETKTMKKAIRRSSSDNNNNMESKTMKKAIRRSSSDNNNNNNNMETKTMKKAIRRSSSDNNNNNPALQAAQILASLDPAILAAIGLTPAKTQEKVTETLKEKASESEPKGQKADRTYEIPSIGADFVKSGIYARPTSEAAAQYVSKAKALCSDVIENLSAPIASDIKTIADHAEKNGGDTLKSDLLQIAEKWEIPAQSMRVIMQLCSPVVGVCNPETDEIARRVYGMSRANSLMGSACNTLMYSKAIDKEKALPFKRVAHNVTALGLDFLECESIEECDFCDDDEDFSELVTLCDYWLAKCERKNPAPEPKSSPRRAAKVEKTAPKSSPEKSEDKSAAILAALQALLSK